MLLLDSQVVLWTLTDSPRLGATARERIARADRVQVSVATVWELTIKTMLGRLEMPRDVAGLLRDQGFAILDITAEHVEATWGFPELLRHDPFDRLIIATAASIRTTLLTADRVMLGLGRDFVLDATR
jgi:PIN domain nuclease of toxin-antitoxin system